ncbi:MAG TPA: exodeoxyribonuclease III [Chromatiales bacterium]|nr:exodeoxyribonuclease III [Chromatiales bacterium]HEX21858.1 exodeoxyribonuclease III [Chromatiales bacterium]
MRVISLNVNGLRAAASKGLFSWLRRQRADVICLQEIRAHRAQISAPDYRLGGFEEFHAEAQKKGYAGVALYTRIRPDRVHRGFGWAEADGEGRYLQADFGDLSVVSLYAPSGSSGAHRQAAKFRFMKRFGAHLRRLAGDGRQYLICGDWNIAHREIDLKNWRANQKNSGFLPQERAWLSSLFDEQGWVDVFRTLNDQPGQYTWWSNRGRAWEKNVGWRIDYQLATAAVAATARRERIYKDQRYSDHAPLIIDYERQR